MLIYRFGTPCYGDSHGTHQQLINQWDLQNLEALRPYVAPLFNQDATALDVWVLNCVDLLV